MGLIVAVFSWALLLAPVVLLVLSLICTYIPGAPAFLMEFFVNYLGEVDLFESSVAVLSALQESEQITAGGFSALVLSLLVSSLAEAGIIACCVFAVKISFMTLSHAKANTFGGIDQIFVTWRYPVFLLTAVGVAIGVVVCGAIGNVVMPALKALLVALLPIAIILWGVAIMIRSAGRFGRPKQIQNTYAVFVELLGEILGNLLITLCAVLAVACLFVGPKFVENGMPRIRLIAMYLLCIAVIYLTYQISIWMRPKTFTNRTPFRF